MLSRRPVAQHLQYLKYRLGITPAAYVLGAPDRPRRITLIIPDSIGDIIINSSVTRYYRTCFPDVHISLITHPKYIPAAEFNPDYDAVYGYGGRFRDIPSGVLSHADQVAIAREVTPDPDRLFLCQPSAWCDALSARYTMLDLQNTLCQVPAERRLLPAAELPAAAVARAAALRAEAPGPAVFLVRYAFTMRFGDGADEYCRRVASWCVDRGIRVYWNGREPILPHDLVTPVEELPLAEAGALATLCDAVISMRCGFSDLVGFTAPKLPHRVLYPPGNYPYSKLSWLAWCSLAGMGVTEATEVVCRFESQAGARSEADATAGWLNQALAPAAR